MYIDKAYEQQRSRSAIQHQASLYHRYAPYVGDINAAQRGDITAGVSVSVEISMVTSVAVYVPLSWCSGYVKA